MGDENESPPVDLRSESSKPRLPTSTSSRTNRRISMRKQNAISVTLTSDCLATTQLNDIAIPTLNLQQQQPQQQAQQSDREAKLQQQQQQDCQSGAELIGNSDEEIANKREPQQQHEHVATSMKDTNQHNHRRHHQSADSMRQQQQSAPQTPPSKQQVNSNSGKLADELKSQPPTTSTAATHQIPNLFFTQLSTIEDQENLEHLAEIAIDGQNHVTSSNNQTTSTSGRHPNRHSSSLSKRITNVYLQPQQQQSQVVNPQQQQQQYYYVTAASPQAQRLASSSSSSNLQKMVGSSHQGPTMLISNAPDGPSTPPSPSRSINSSPRINRRLGGNNNGESQHQSQPQVLLGVSSPSFSRKFSLQPMGQQSNQQTQQQQQQPAIQQYILLDHNHHHSYQMHQHQQQQNQFGGAANLLGVSTPLMHRKSLIGRLERSSFQTQRLSDVGVSIGQQITAKMGLKLPASQERIVEQTRWLYRRYVFVKLRQNKLPLRDLNLTKSSRARRAAALLSSPLGTGPISSPFMTRTPATTSLSAPASASLTTNATEPPAPSRLGARKRTAVSGELDGQQLSMLTERMQNLKRNNSENLMAINENKSLPVTRQQVLLSAQSAAPIRKHVMDPTINNQILSVILNINRELRDLKPEFYGDTIFELIGIDKFSSLETLLEAQMTICQEMTRQEISWCRITALFSLFGAMSLDCVRLGAPEHVGPILDGFIQFVERDLALWISQQGGWESFLYKYQAGFRFGPTISKALALALPLFVWAILSLSRW